MNPLLDFSGLPRFAEIKPEHVAPAIDQLLAENRALIARLLDDGAPPSWQDFIVPMEDANERLSRAWGPVGHLNAVMNSPELREVYNATLPIITQYYAELGQNLALFDKFKALRNSPEFGTLSAARKRIVENELRDFRLGGAELPEGQKKRYLEIQERLADLSSRFSDNLLDATNDYTLVIEDKNELRGLPEDVLQAAQEAAHAADKVGWLFTLKSPSYLPFMQYAYNRNLRERMYRAYSTRASVLGKIEWDNTPLITEILKLRSEEARLLNYQNYAEVSLVPKMAKSPEQVHKFLCDITKRATPSANVELDELREVAKLSFGLDELAPWDMPFLTEHLRSSKFGFSNNQLRAYFPLPKVLEGMLQLAEKLFGVDFERGNADTWHPKVVHLKVIENTILQGHLFLDLFVRDSKHEGAWMNPTISRSRKLEGVQVAVAYVVCDFTPPSNDVLPTLTHQEVLTLFHEFGHALHHLLSKIDDPAVSGVRGVEWDAVEIPSQFMECFAWEWHVLQTISGNLSTGETLPKELYEAMRSSKNFHSARRLVVSCVYAMFDLAAHMSDSNKAPIDLFREIHRKYSGVPFASFAYPINQLAHIFSGAYAAGLYSYEWADVLAADIYAMFQSTLVSEDGAANTVKKELFETGGSRPMIESFHAMRGRDPDPAFYFRSLGLTESDACSQA